MCIDRQLTDLFLFKRRQKTYFKFFPLFHYEILFQSGYNSIILILLCPFLWTDFHKEYSLNIDKLCPENLPDFIKKVYRAITLKPIVFEVNAKKIYEDICNESKTSFNLRNVKSGDNKKHIYLAIVILAGDKMLCRYTQMMVTIRPTVVR